MPSNEDNSNQQHKKKKITRKINKIPNLSKKKMAQYTTNEPNNNKKSRILSSKEEKQIELTAHKIYIKLNDAQHQVREAR